MSETMRPEARPFIAATRAFADGGAEGDSPRAFLERCIETIEAREPVVGAFVETNLEGARAAADAAGGRWTSGAPLSPIDGMPVGIKDIMETADMETGQDPAACGKRQPGAICGAIF